MKSPFTDILGGKAVFAHYHVAGGRGSKAINTDNFNIATHIGPPAERNPCLHCQNWSAGRKNLIAVCLRLLFEEIPAWQTHYPSRYTVTHQHLPPAQRYMHF